MRKSRFLVPFILKKIDYCLLKTHSPVISINVCRFTKAWAAGFITGAVARSFKRMALLRCAVLRAHATRALIFARRRPCPGEFAPIHRRDAVQRRRDTAKIIGTGKTKYKGIDESIIIN